MVTVLLIIYLIGLIPILINWTKDLINEYNLLIGILITVFYPLFLLIILIEFTTGR